MNAKHVESHKERQPEQMAQEKMQPLLVTTLERKEGSKTNLPTALKRGLLELLINGLFFFFL